MNDSGSQTAGAAGYTDEQVPRDVIERLLAIAQRTPSWCNTQPWQLVITSGEETVRLKEALLESFGSSGSDFDFPVGYHVDHPTNTYRTSRASLDEVVTFVG